MRSTRKNAIFDMSSHGLDHNFSVVLQVRRDSTYGEIARRTRNQKATFASACTACGQSSGATSVMAMWFDTEEANATKALMLMQRA